MNGVLAVIALGDNIVERGNDSGIGTRRMPQQSR